MSAYINKKLYRFTTGILLALCACSLFAWAQDFQRPYGWVNDYAGVIDEQYEQKITSVITDLEEKTTAEIAVVTMDSIAPYSEQEYANKLFDLWKVGKRGEDNGLIVLVAIQERRWRIEVGYGLEGIITDSIAGDIGRNYMVPYLKEGKYGEGIYNGVVALAKKISKGTGIPVAALESLKSCKRSEPVPLFLYVFAPAFFFLWNLPWPFIIGFPFTLLFASAFYQMSPVLGALVIAGYIGSLIVRYNYWSKLPPHKRNSFFGTQTYGTTSHYGTHSGGGFSGGGGGGFGGFGGGSSGGGGAGGGF